MILVTGGTGLVGSHLLFDLVQSDETIRAIYRSKSRIEKVKQLFCFLDSHKGSDLFKKIEWVQCDVLDVVALTDAFVGVKQVYHCAALVSFHKKDFSDLMQVNRIGTSNVVNECLNANVEKLAYVSSTAAIGSGKSFVSESDKWEQSPHTSGYSISKYSAEKEVWRAKEEGLNVVVINPCIIFGAGDWSEGSLTIFNTIKNGLQFYTSGANAFVDARDVSKVLIQLMNTNEFLNERFLCIGENTSFKTVFDKIASQLKRSPIKYKVSPMLVNLSWRIASVISLFTRRKPTITKDSARSAFKTTVYNKAKLDEAIGHQFYALDETIDYVISYQSKT